MYESNDAYTLFLMEQPIPPLKYQECEMPYGFTCTGFIFPSTCKLLYCNISRLSS